MILDLGSLPSSAPHAHVVHAGLVPGLSMTRQDPIAVMNMRSIDLRTHTPSQDHAPRTIRSLQDAKSKIDKNMDIAEGGQGKPFRKENPDIPAPWGGRKRVINRMFDVDEKYVAPWAELWEEYMRTLKVDEERELVIYGHDSSVGLVERDWAVGLDSGCVYGGRLSALVLEMRGGKVGRTVESVKCPRRART